MGARGGPALAAVTACVSADGLALEGCMHRERVDLPPALGGGTISIEDAPATEPLPVGFPIGAWVAPRLVMQADYLLVPHEPGEVLDPRAVASFIDWRATMAERERLAALGYGIAEGVGPGQRDLVGWDVARDLCARTAQLAPTGGVLAGAAADRSLRIGTREELVAAVMSEARHLQELGATVVLLPLPWLREHDCSVDQEVATYLEILAGLDQPALLQWLELAPSEASAFGGSTFERLIEEAEDRLLGVHLALADAAREAALREQCRVRGRCVLSGDRTTWRLLAGAPEASGAAQVSVGARRLSAGTACHVLLPGADAAAGPLGRILLALAAGDHPQAEALDGALGPLLAHLATGPEGAHVADIAFLGWLAGHQDNPMVLGRRDRLRDREHLVATARLAAAAGVFPDSGLTASRLRSWLAMPSAHF